MPVEDMRAMRLRTPPGLWMTGLEEVEGLSDIDAGQTLNQGLSTQSYLANHRQDKFDRQIEHSRHRKNQPRRRGSVVLQMEMRRSLLDLAMPIPCSKQKSACSDMNLLSVGTSMDAQVEYYQKEEARKKRTERDQKAKLARLLAEESLDDVDGPGALERIEREAAEFLKETEKVGLRIQDTVRRLRLEKLAPGARDAQKGEEDKARREEEQRQKDLAVKRARKREQAARDPHKKVDIKIENTREFGVDASVSATIPMQKNDFVGSSGVREQVRMVDPNALRNRCHNLENGTTVTTLLQATAEEDRRKELLQISQTMQLQMNETFLVRCQTAPDLRSVGSLIDIDISRPMTGLPLFGNERLRMARARRQAGFEDSSVHKFSAMRGELPESVSERFGFINQTMVHHFQKDSDQHSEYSSALGSTTGTTRPRSGPRRKNTMDSDLNPGTPQAHGEDFFPAGARRGNRGRGFSNTDVEKAITAHTKANKNWSIVRAATFYIGRLCEVRKHDLAIAEVKAFIQKVGEWTRIKHAMKKLVNDIVKVQVAFREHLQKKRKCMFEMQKAWTAYEDDFLSTYFMIYFKKLFQDPTKEDAKTADLTQGALESEAFMGDICHWTQYRLPLADKTLALEKFYLSQLRKHIQTEQKWMGELKLVTQNCWQKDLEMWVKHLDGEEDEVFHESEQDASRRQGIEEHRWWELPKDSGLELIASLAKSLSNVDPFHNHPANNDVLEKLLGLQGQKKTKNMSANQMSKKLMVLPAGMEYARSRGSKLDSNVPIDDLDDVISDKPEAEVQNLEQLLETFTPRIREGFDEERAASEPDLSEVPDSLRDARVRPTKALRRPSILTSAVTRPQLQ